MRAASCTPCWSSRDEGISGTRKIGVVAFASPPPERLLIAALAYKRQVGDARRAQAAKVTVTAIENDIGKAVVEVENNSDEPIYKVRWDVTIMSRKEMSR